jgi:hypothetical protein
MKKTHNKIRKVNKMWMHEFQIKIMAWHETDTGERRLEAGWGKV